MHELPREDRRRSQVNGKSRKRHTSSLIWKNARCFWRERYWDSINLRGRQHGSFGIQSKQGGSSDAPSARCAPQGRQRDPAPLVLDLDHRPPETTAAHTPEAPIGLPRVATVQRPKVQASSQDSDKLRRNSSSTQGHRPVREYQWQSERKIQQRHGLKRRKQSMDMRLRVLRCQHCSLQLGHMVKTT